MLAGLFYEWLKCMFPNVNFKHLLLKFLAVMAALGLLFRVYDWLFAKAH